MEGPRGAAQPAGRKPCDRVRAGGRVRADLPNWLPLHAVGVDASFFDAIAVLIALVTLAQLPVGPSVGAAAAVLILGSDGVAQAAAAGLLLTVTGTVGGLCFAAWAGADRLWSMNRLAAVRRTRAGAQQSGSDH